MGPRPWGGRGSGRPQLPPTLGRVELGGGGHNHPLPTLEYSFQAGSPWLAVAEEPQSSLSQGREQREHMGAPQSVQRSLGPQGMSRVSEAASHRVQEPAGLERDGWRAPGRVHGRASDKVP